MEKLSLIEAQTQEMSKNELKRINGGVRGILRCVCLAALALGYADGRSDKHGKK